MFSCLRKLHAVSAVAAPVAFPTTLHKALFPPHFGSSCLFPGSRVSVTRAVTSPGSGVCSPQVDAEPLSMSVWSFGCRLLRDSCSGPVPMEKPGWCYFALSCVSALYIGAVDPYQMCGLQASPVAPTASPVTVSSVVKVLFTGPRWSGSVSAACAFGVISKETLFSPVSRRSLPLCPLVPSWFQALCLSLCCVLR